MSGDEVHAVPARLGPFFAVTPAPADPAGWRPLSALLDPGTVAARAAATRSALAGGRPADEVPRRVAASVAHLGLVARLLSPVLALAALHDVRQVPTVEDLLWRDEPGSTFPLALRAPLQPGPADLRAWADDVVARLVLPLDAAWSAPCPSRHVRLGNVASGVHGALLVLGPAGDAPGRALLAHPLLRNASTGVARRETFRRNSCCLIYRAAPAREVRSVCSDCVLRDARGGLTR